MLREGARSARSIQEEFQGLTCDNVGFPHFHRPYYYNYKNLRYIREDQEQRAKPENPHSYVMPIIRNVSRETFEPL